MMIDFNPAHSDRLESIVCEVQTRQVTMSPGREPRNDELLVAEIVRLRAELIDYWWYAMHHECTERVDGWLQPFMSEAEYASGELVKAGRAEKHPDKNWYRPVKQPCVGCPSCGGPTEYDRCDPPSPYYREDCEGSQ